jgi:hypothetical protein
MDEHDGYALGQSATLSKVATANGYLGHLCRSGQWYQRKHGAISGASYASTLSLKPRRIRPPCCDQRDWPASAPPSDC